MKKKRFIKEQIIKVLKEYERGHEIKDLYRKFDITSPTSFIIWRKKYSGMDINQIRPIKSEITTLRQICADQA